MDELALVAEGDWPFQTLLWQRVRDVRMWAAAPPDGRTGLFIQPPPEWQVDAEAAAFEVEPLAEPVRVLSALTRYPQIVHADDVSVACIAVSEWAHGNHLSLTALNFAEAAGVANPLSARAAAHAGQFCARQAVDHRAEVWYERGIKLGRAAKDWEWYVRSNLRLGILRYEQGDFRSARVCYGRARSKAIWAGLPAFAGKAHHDMLLIAIAGRSFSNGDHHARRALDYYPVHYGRLPQLAHDYAVLLTTLRYDRPALALLDLVLPLIVLPSERIAVLGSIAKAAAGMGDVLRHAATTEDVLVLAAMSEVNAAGALSLASEGALVLGQWERAAHLAALGLDVAMRRREREPQRRAEAVLAGAASRRLAEVPPLVPALQRVTETIVLFVARLQGLGAQTTDAGAHSRGRAELTRFTIAGR